MGQTTPNISIYIPAAGETNYDQSFAMGMLNIDQHDHSGGPTKGVPISGSGIATGSITYDKLAANVVDVTSGLGTLGGGLANQITTTGLLLALAHLAGNGIISKNGTAVNGRTITGTANQVAVANGDGIAGNPTLSLPSTIYTNISFNSGTNTLDTYATGTFMPGVAFGGGSTGVTYGARNGVYWKIGKVIFWGFVMSLTNKGSSTGAVTITGFPFTVAAGLDQTFSVLTVNAAYPGSCTNTSGILTAGATTMALWGVGSSTFTQFTEVEFTNTTVVQATGLYWEA